jgi:hypothetical protein
MYDTPNMNAMLKNHGPSHGWKNEFPLRDLLQTTPLYGRFQPMLSGDADDVI